MERCPRRGASFLSVEVARDDEDARARGAALRHVGTRRGRRRSARGRRELQAWFRRRRDDVDRRAGDARASDALPAVAARRTAAACELCGVNWDEIASRGWDAVWDDAAVRSAGGHTMQSMAWARARTGQGWRGQLVQMGDPLPAALVLWRSTPLGRPIAYVPRGPIVVPGDGAMLASALARLAALAREWNAIFLKVDPEIPPDAASEVLREAGFRRGPDIQPVLAT